MSNESLHFYAQDHGSCRNRWVFPTNGLPMTRHHKCIVPCNHQQQRENCQYYSPHMLQCLLLHETSSSCKNQPTKPTNQTNQTKPNQATKQHSVVLPWSSCYLQSVAPPSPRHPHTNHGRERMETLDLCAPPPPRCEWPNTLGALATLADACAQAMGLWVG